MTVNDILKLTNAGWSKEEISTMIANESGVLKDPEPPKEEPKKAEPEDKDDAVLEAIKQLTNSIIANNLNNNSQKEQAEDTNDILAKLLMPEGVIDDGK